MSVSGFCVRLTTSTIYSKVSLLKPLDTRTGPLIRPAHFGPKHMCYCVSLLRPASHEDHFSWAWRGALLAELNGNTPIQMIDTIFINGQVSKVHDIYNIVHVLSIYIYLYCLLWSQIRILAFIVLHVCLFPTLIESTHIICSCGVPK